MKGNNLTFGPWIIFELIIEVILLIIQAVAIWKSARYEQKKWFIALFIAIIIPIPLFSILDIVYLFKFAKKPLTVHEIKSWFQKKTR